MGSTTRHVVERYVHYVYSLAYLTGCHAHYTASKIQGGILKLPLKGAFGGAPAGSRSVTVALLSRVSVVRRPQLLLLDRSIAGCMDARAARRTKGPYQTAGGTISRWAGPC